MVAPVRKGRYNIKQNYVKPPSYTRYSNSFWFPGLRYLQLPSTKLFRDQYGRGIGYKNKLALKYKNKNGRILYNTPLHKIKKSYTRFN